MIADSGGSVSTSPDAEIHVGHCFPVTGRALRAGLRPAVSTDITIQVGGDMFGAMRSILSAERGLVGAAAYERGEAPSRWEVLTRDVLEFATIEGARASGLDARIGTLTPGKDADLVILDTGAWNMIPMNNAIGLTVLQAHVGNVDAVFVKGRQVKRDGKLLGVDGERIRKGVEGTRDHLFAQAGLATGFDHRPAAPGRQWLW
ncbi:MAG TPA: amidohydrolase family protein [Euzebyales bacterium]|nr:amidohydrolase family protein [Euzebyales bacterium]